MRRCLIHVSQDAEVLCLSYDTISLEEQIADGYLRIFVQTTLSLSRRYITAKPTKKNFT